MNLPSRAECLTLFQTYRTPKHVIEHCFTVNKVAVFLAKAIEKRGDEINVALVDAASLLHDLLRVINFDSFDPERFRQTITHEDLETWRAQKKKFGNIHHGTAARLELEELGYPEVGEVVEAHRASAIREPDVLDTIEKQCVFYADKRVAHTEIVSIEGRYQEWFERHNWSQEKRKEVEHTKKLVLELEKELFIGLRLKPSALTKLAK